LLRYSKAVIEKSVCDHGLKNHFLEHEHEPQIWTENNKFKQ